MLIVLRKTYTVEVVIQEGNDEFWEGFSGRTGADEVVREVANCLAEHGFVEPNCRVRLTRFSEEA